MVGSATIAPTNRDFGASNQRSAGHHQRGQVASEADQSEACSFESRDVVPSLQQKSSGSSGVSYNNLRLKLNERDSM